MNPGRMTVDRASDAYDQGNLAYRMGIEQDRCPHEKDQNRIDWFSGWLDAWSERKYRRIWAKYGVADANNRSR